MKIQLNATSFNLRDDTESHQTTDGLVKFLNDHSVPFSYNVMPGATRRLRPEYYIVTWHENDSVVEVEELVSIKNLQDFCKKYDAYFKITEDGAIIYFD